MELVYGLLIFEHLYEVSCLLEKLRNVGGGHNVHSESNKSKSGLRLPQVWPKSVGFDK